MKVYLTIALIWSLYAVYKTRQRGYMGKDMKNQILTFLINFFLFPFCLFYAIKNKKF